MLRPNIHNSDKFPPPPKRPYRRGRSPLRRAGRRANTLLDIGDCRNLPGVLFCSIVDIRDKLAVVTGGARRVGRGIAEALAEAGARIVIHYHRSHAEAHELARQVGGEVVQADLSLAGGAAQLMEAVLRIEGTLAVWVNSASVLERSDFLESDDALWQRTLQLTLLSPVTCSREAARHMSAGGVIVNVLDVAAHQPWKGYAHHAVAKAGLHMLTRALAVELAPKVRVCGVTPGLVVSPEDGSPWSSLVQRVPLLRTGEPRDVGQAVRYLVEADYVTGSVVSVDGGLLSRSPAPSR